MQVARQLAPHGLNHLPRLPEQVRPGRAEAPVAPPMRRQRRTPLVALALCWCSVVAGGLYVVHRQAELARIGFAMTAMRVELSRLEAENEALAAKVNEYKSISRIEAIATRPVNKGGLGMINPQQLRLAVVDPGSLAGEAPTAPAPTVAGSVATTIRSEEVPAFWQRVLGFLSALRGRPAEAVAGGR